jgi:hypothetical protein
VTLAARSNVVGTAVFTVVTALAALRFTDFWRAAVIVVDLALFAVGVAGFLWGFSVAVARSRTETIGVGQLFLLLGATAPRAVKSVMWSCLAAQVVVGLAGALARPDTDGRPGSALAFGVLVPMFGLGLNGWWAARHGHFTAREG